MKKVAWMTMVLACGLLVLTGCDDDDGGDAAAADGSVTAADAGAGSGGDAGADDGAVADAGADADAGQDADAAWGEIVPSGITQTSKVVDKDTNTTTITIECDPIAGAIRYMFNVSTGNKTVLTANPTAVVELTVAQGAQSYECCVFAYNENNETTQVTCVRLND